MPAISVRSRSAAATAVIDLVRRRYHEFIGENPLLTERLWRKIWEIDRVEEIHMRALGLLDVLCWDVKSQHARMPIYQTARRRRSGRAGLCLDGHLANNGGVRALHQEEPRRRLQGLQAARLGRAGEARYRAVHQPPQMGRATTRT
jgi:L-alanine-DL-glutamate epimerase-like enolase superfamily enzyme